MTRLKRSKENERGKWRKKREEREREKKNRRIINEVDRGRKFMGS